MLFEPLFYQVLVITCICSAGRSRIVCPEPKQVLLPCMTVKHSLSMWFLLWLYGLTSFSSSQQANMMALVNEDKLLQLCQCPSLLQINLESLWGIAMNEDISLIRNILNVIFDIQQWEVNRQSVCSALPSPWYKG